jgi:hypothetical protein
MIPRYQTVLFFTLLIASAVMGVVLWQLLDRAHQRRLQGEDSAPLPAPAIAPPIETTFLVANDRENSLVRQTLTLPLPQSTNARAKAILGKLLDLYAAPNSTHPVPGGAASITGVFLLPVPADAAATGSSAAAPNAEASSAATPGSSAANNAPGGDQLAVVNLTSAFVANHPSGLEAETLTVLSICSTLHANLAAVTQVRFLVDGQPRATLAGHADLTRNYMAADSAPSDGAHP